MAITVDHATVGTELTQAEYEASSGAAHSVSGEVAQASQAALEAETNENTYPPPDLMKHSPGVAKGYCRITEAGAIVSGDYNVASVTDVGVGDRTIVWDIDFADTNYSCVGALDTATQVPSIWRNHTPAAGSIKIQINETESTYPKIDEGDTHTAFGLQV